VLPFNPSLPANAATLTTFRTHYGIGTNAILLGAYLGALSDTATPCASNVPMNRPPANPLSPHAAGR
jgi:hypothetical protein